MPLAWDARAETPPSVSRSSPPEGKYVRLHQDDIRDMKLPEPWNSSMPSNTSTVRPKASTRKAIVIFDVSFSIPSPNRLSQARDLSCLGKWLQV